MIRTVRIPLRGRLGSDDQLGCLSWPACVAGGTLCPQPDSFGASLNPCCHFTAPTGPCPDDVAPTPNADGSYGFVGSAIDSATAALNSTVAGSIPTWVWLAGAGAIAAGLFLGRR